MSRTSGSVALAVKSPGVPATYWKRARPARSAIGPGTSTEMYNRSSALVGRSIGSLSTGALAGSTIADCPAKVTARSLPATTAPSAAAMPTCTAPRVSASAPSSLENFRRRRVPSAETRTSCRTVVLRISAVVRSTGQSLPGFSSSGGGKHPRGAGGVTGVGRDPQWRRRRRGRPRRAWRQGRGTGAAGRLGRHHVTPYSDPAVIGRARCRRGGTLCQQADEQRRRQDLSRNPHDRRPLPSGRVTRDWYLMSCQV